MNEAVLYGNVDAQVTRLERLKDVLKVILQNPAVHAHTSTAHTLLLASVLKMISAAEAVRVLADTCSVEEILAIGQTMLEGTVNAVFLQHASEKEVERYLTFRPEIRSHTALSVPVQRRSTLSSLQSFLGSIIHRLPGKYKEKVDTWSRLTLADRARFADEASNIPVMGLLVTRCSFRGKAAANGTMGSLDYFVAALTDTPAAQQEHRLVALTEALFGVNLCMFTLSFYLSNHFDLRLDRAIENAANARSLYYQGGEESPPSSRLEM